MEGTRTKKPGVERGSGTSPRLLGLLDNGSLDEPQEMWRIKVKASVYVTADITVSKSWDGEVTEEAWGQPSASPVRTHFPGPDAPTGILPAPTLPPVPSQLLPILWGSAQMSNSQRDISSLIPIITACLFPSQLLSQAVVNMFLYFFIVCLHL